MEKDNSVQGSGLSVTGISLLALAFVVTFLLKQCIFGTIIAIISTILATAGFLEARRTGGQSRSTLTILVIVVLGTLVQIAWLASGPVSNNSGKKTEFLIDTLELQRGEDTDTEKILEELEEKAEKLERGDSL